MEMMYLQKQNHLDVSTVILPHRWAFLTLFVLAGN